MLRLVGVTIPEDVDLFNGLRMIKGLDTKNSRAKIETYLTKAGLYNRQLQPNGKLEKVYPKVADLSWKEKARLIDVVDMPRAVLRNIHSSPKKLRLIADAIRGKSVDEAMATLQFMQKGEAPTLLKLLKSAIANAGANHDLRADDLYIAKITIDGGATMKRFMARGRGRACRIRKRTSHAQIVLRERFSMAKFAVSEKTQDAAAKKTVKKAPAKTAAKSTAPKAEKAATAKKPAAKKTTKSQGGKA
ncbi:MAG TPA: 50S ribosomal protein L22 [Candidatus Rifleibacterium sp.]|nr:50S ribosomal protein L22 [Candidatus Rifleibacterium sp.]